MEQIKQKLNKTFKVKGPYAAGDALKAIGLDEASVNQALARLNELGGKLKGFQSKTCTFSSTNSAALGISQVLKAEVAALRKPLATSKSFEAIRPCCESIRGWRPLARPTKIPKH